MPFGRLGDEYECAGGRPSQLGLSRIRRPVLRGLGAKNHRFLRQPSVFKLERLDAGHHSMLDNLHWQRQQFVHASFGQSNAYSAVVADCTGEREPGSLDRWKLGGSLFHVEGRH
jgi:hypothetical protein